MASKNNKKPLAPVAPVADEDRAKALEMAKSQLTKKFGDGIIMKLGENTHMNVQAVHTGSIALDMALGIGGVPKGRIIEIYGPESSGKTTLALHILAEVQKDGGEAAFIDAEHALDPTYAKAIGVDIDNLLVSQPDSGEDALEVTEVLVRSGAIAAIVVDSVAALTPQQEIEGDMGSTHVGLQARLMSQAMRKLSSVVSKSQCIVIFINQIREKVGVIYGNPEVTPGGRALKFYSSVRIEVRKGEPIKDGAEVIGSRTKAKVVKNKCAPPFRSCEFDMLYGQGISRSGELIDIGVQLEIIKKSGAWFSYNGERLGQGKDNTRAALEANPELYAEIEAKIRSMQEQIPVMEEEFEMVDDEEGDDDFDIRSLKLDEAGDE
ncbi:MAG: recombinase RecA [Clostridia bacterium]|nr:recombinase RecA [Clostridia bacterium]